MTTKIIVIGASLGGLKALGTLLRGLDANFSVPIAIVQHRIKSSEDLLSILLQKCTPLTVKEVEDKEELRPGTVYLAPADYHLLIDRAGFTLSLEAPIHHARPAIDTLFDSAAETYGKDVIAVVLTGGNADGAHGASLIKQAGGTVVVQDPAECESSIMPLAAIKSSEVDKVLRLEEIAPFLMEHCQTPGRVDRGLQ